VTLNPYLHFGSNAREAMEFYRSVFGGDLEVATFAFFGMVEDPAEADLVMHSYLSTDAGLELMGSDTPARMTRPSGTAVTLALGGTAVDRPTLQGYWDRLSEGATIGAELGPAPWGADYGQLTDRYGVQWLVNIGPDEPRG
jgi:PhnB protein